MIIPALAATILVGYAASLWSLLRRESAITLLGLLAVCGLALFLRVLYTTDFPAGLNEDEVKALACVGSGTTARNLFTEACNGPPRLLMALFQVPLIGVFGPGRWAIRTYSLVASILAVPAAFAVVRIMGGRLGAGVAVAVLVAVLPWSIFHGRISLGGELVFHELLLIAALARLVWASGGLGEIGMGALGLSLLLYDYACGRGLVALPIVAAVLARGRRRVWCLAVLLVAVACWVPHLRMAPSQVAYGFSLKGVRPEFFENPIQSILARTVSTLQTFVEPVAWDSLFGVRFAAVHPMVVLALAAIGTLTGVRRATFLLSGFALGLAPAVASWGDRPSTHRMLMAFPFIALAAGLALDLIRPRALRTAVTIVVSVVAVVQSVQIYFSSDSWPREGGAPFDWERTALVESLPLPPHPRMIASPSIGYFLEPRKLIDADIEALSPDNWYPPNEGAIYAFSPLDAPLRPFYDDLFGPERVDVFGRAFVVRLAKGDWSWTRKHGWAYQVVCAGEAQTGQVPTLFQSVQSVRSWRCPEPAKHTWRGRWNGPDVRARIFSHSGKTRVQIGPTTAVEMEGFEQRAEFDLKNGATVTVAVTAPPATLLKVSLTEITPAGLRVPTWETVTPVFEEAAGGPGSKG